MRKVLFVAVHPDDETLGAGGTILKHKDAGDQIFWLVVTAPTKNHPCGFSDAFIEKRDKLVDESASAYGFDGTYKLNLPTQMLHSVDIRYFVSLVDDVINQVEPDTIYMMFKNDVHSDHRVSFDAVYSCTKSFRKAFIHRIYMIEALSETEFAPAIPSFTFTPNVYVDISPYIDRKLEIMALYDKELMLEPYPRSLGSIRALARVRGTRAGVMYAEAFQLLYERL